MITKPFKETRRQTDLNGGGLEQGNLVLTGELQETRQLFSKVHDLLHRHDCQLGEMSKALLPHFPVHGVLTLRPWLKGRTGKGRGSKKEVIK